MLKLIIKNNSNTHLYKVIWIVPKTLFLKSRKTTIQKKKSLKTCENYESRRLTKELFFFVLKKFPREGYNRTRRKKRLVMHSYVQSNARDYKATWSIIHARIESGNWNGSKETAKRMVMVWWPINKMILV